MSLSPPKNYIIIGLSGVTCGGKTTAAQQLQKKLHPHCKIFSQDDYFLEEDDPRHLWVPDLEHIHFDLLSSLDMKKMHEDILDYIHKRNCLSNNSKSIINNFKEKFKAGQVEVIIIEGFTVFNYAPFKDLFNLKYFFTLDEKECRRRRMLRRYEPPDCPGYFEKCVWPEYVKHLAEVKAQEEVIFFNEDSKGPSLTILEDIFSY